MKKLLLALIALTGLAAFTPRAEAGQFARVNNGYGTVYVHKSQLYSPYSSGYSNHYRNNYRSSRYRSYASSRGYYRPSYVSYPYYSDYSGYSDHGYSDYGYSRPYCGHHRSHHHRPHISIAFGF